MHVDASAAKKITTVKWCDRSRSRSRYRIGLKAGSWKQAGCQLSTQFVLTKAGGFYSTYYGTLTGCNACRAAARACRCLLGPTWSHPGCSSCCTCRPIVWTACRYLLGTLG